MAIKVTPLSTCLGATVEGLEVPENGVSPDDANELREAWLAHKVLFFPRIHLTDDQHIALGSVFGELAATTPGDEGDNRDTEKVDGHDEILVIDSNRGKPPTDNWHTDVTWSENPPIGSLLSAKIIPSRGGDTLWADTQASLRALPDEIRGAIEAKKAVHGRPPLTQTTVHPMIKPHDETGVPGLFVNRGWTSRITGMAPHLSQDLLSLLFNHMERPDFSTRWSWTEGDAALWDNRCTMHYATYDYTERRKIHRVTIFA